MNAPRPLSALLPPINKIEFAAVFTLFSVPAMDILAAIAASRGDFDASYTMSYSGVAGSSAATLAGAATSGAGVAASEGGIIIGVPGVCVSPLMATAGVTAGVWTTDAGPVGAGVPFA
jgi:hypothetical protein